MEVEIEVARVDEAQVEGDGAYGAGAVSSPPSGTPQQLPSSAATGHTGDLSTDGTGAVPILGGACVPPSEALA